MIDRIIKITILTSKLSNHDSQHCHQPRAINLISPSRVSPSNPTTADDKLPNGQTPSHHTQKGICRRRFKKIEIDPI
jgi:hypothetical protein